MSLQKSRLKKPIILQIISLLFILAPIGNIMISFYGVGSDEWTKPAVFIGWLSTVDSWDWFWLILTFMTGVLLFIQHKTAWLIAVINLLLILSVNIYRWMTTGELIDVEYSYFENQILVSILTTALALGILFYARYPYLDRRSGWMGPVAPRKDVKTIVTVVAQDVYNGFATNISTSGAIVELNQSLGSAGKMKFIDLIFPELGNIKIKAQVIHTHEHQIRIKFKDLTGSDKKTIKIWMQSQS